MAALSIERNVKNKKTKKQQKTKKKEKLFIGSHH